MNVSIFSNYLLFNVGGAEPSLILLAEKFNPEGNFKLYSFKNPKIHKINPLKNQIPKNTEIAFVPRSFGFSFFPFVEYVLNRRKLKSFFKNSKEDLIISSSIYAPIALNSSQAKRKIIYLQSDIDIGKANGISNKKSILKYIYNSIQYPFIQIFISDLKKTIQEAEVYVNSNFMGQLLEKKYGIKKYIVQYPIIDEENLKNDFEKKKNEIKNKGIVFVGDAPHKGDFMAAAISKNFLGETFYFFSKKEKVKRVEGNVIFMPWQSSAVDVYKYAKLVIMPSQWEETYGRVAREADLLGIPVLASNVGGLPEALSLKEECLVKDYKNPTAWEIALKKALGHEG